LSEVILTEEFNSKVAPNLYKFFGLTHKKDILKNNW